MSEDFVLFVKFEVILSRLDCAKCYVNSALTPENSELLCTTEISGVF